MTSNEKMYLNVKEVAELLCYSKPYIYRLASEGVLPHYKPTPRRLIFKRTEVLEWLESGGYAGITESGYHSFNMKQAQAKLLNK